MIALPLTARRTFVCGCDLGQSRDYSTFAVLDVRPGDNPREPRLDGVHLERFPLGTLYPEIVRRVAARLDTVDAMTPRPHLTLAVDWTGVGRAVVDQFEEARLPDGRRLPGRLVPVSIHGGNAVSRDGRGWSVPKRDLVSSVQVALQAGRLKIAKGLPEAETFVREATAVRMTISPAGHDSYAAWREGDHDDLVLAVALACWAADNLPSGKGWVM